MFWTLDGLDTALAQLNSFVFWEVGERKYEILF